MYKSKCVSTAKTRTQAAQLRLQYVTPRAIRYAWQKDIAKKVNAYKKTYPFKKVYDLSQNPSRGFGGTELADGSLATLKTNTKMFSTVAHRMFESEEGSMM